MRIAVLSDTHAPRHWKSCPPRWPRRLREVDLILHAGDVCTAAVLDELSGFAPVHAVLGNNDGPDVADWGAPERAEFELAGLPVAMIHDSGPAPVGRLGCAGRSRPPGWSIFGHSHIPWDETEAACGPSTPARRPTGAGSRSAPWVC